MPRSYREHMLVLGSMYLVVCFIYWNSTHIVYQIEDRLSYKAILHALPFQRAKNTCPAFVQSLYSP